MRALFFVACSCLLLACPRDVEEPEPPLDGEACVTDDQCTPAEAPCGVVYACVHGYCEQQPSRALPCDD